ncbi:MAG: LuxR C-terminal-related transcriptional regulator [Dehalococcoidia bacterium]
MDQGTLVQGPGASGAEAAVILESKLHSPLLHPEHISRPRLLRRLDEGLARRLTLVDAPAGSGKSTLIAEWCASEPIAGRVAWLLLDEQDNDPSTFWTYVIRALRSVEPARFGAGLQALRSPGVRVTRSILPDVLNELWSVDRSIVLVLDDLHEITNGECFESLRFFTQRLPPTLHLVISTRSDPPLPLGQWRARGELCELRAVDLRFTGEEVSELLNESLQLGLATEDLKRLEERTEGWAAGLYLAALTLRDRADTRAFIDEFAGHDRHIVDYLGGEVLDRLPEDVRSFLMQTSILESFSAPLCDAVTGGSDAREQLHALEGTNLFLIPLDQRREWYRYHRLFGELLHVELRRTQPAAVPILHQRAAAWYRAAGDASAAMEHALTGIDFSLAGEIFLQFYRLLQASGRLATVFDWMRRFPEEAIARNPPLAIAMAWITGLTAGHREEIERYLELVEHCTHAGPFTFGERSISEAVALLRAGFAFDDVGGLLEAAKAAVQQLNDPRTIAFYMARSSLGHALFLSGRWEDARTTLEEVVESPRGHEHPVVTARATGQLARVWLELGDLARAEELARRAEQLCEAHGLVDHPSLWVAHVALGAVLLRRGMVEAAESLLLQRVEPRLHEFRTWPCSLLPALLALAPVHHARGHVQAARSLLDEARAVIASCSDPGVFPELLRRTERELHRLPRRSTGLHEDLSQGELRVLRLLASDLTRREIAQELYLSVNTIKAHTRSIYAKLNADSRPEAVAQARSLNLIA